jgi:hypothetical protein
MIAVDFNRLHGLPKSCAGQLPTSLLAPKRFSVFFSSFRQLKIIFSHGVKIGTEFLSTMSMLSKTEFKAHAHYS